LAGILKVDQVQSDSNLSFQVAGANVAYMNSTGLQMTGGQITAGGNTLLTASGLIYANAGIAFPATQVASGNANTLDDYEEGSWTPTDVSGAGLSFSTTSAQYVKIGQLVYVQGYLTFPVTSSTATVIIGGLPFALNGNNHYAYGPCRVQVPNIIAAVQFNSGGTSFYIYSNGSTPYLNNQLSGGYVLFTGCYQAAA